jgi:uncharacterized protein YlxP (DUF503 family)
MVVSMLQFIIDLPEIYSLKDKRRIVKSIKDRLIQKYKLSAAEVDLLDSLRFANIGAALVSNSKKHGEAVLHSAFAFIEDNVEGRIVDCKIVSEIF